MSTHAQLESRAISIPGLSITVEESRLICSVFDAVQHVDWPQSGRSLHQDPTPDAVLQSLLTYCYAVGIVASDEIESAAIHDSAVRYLCANHTPKWETIREFRRRHGPFLKSSVAALFKIIANPTDPSSSSSGYYTNDSLERFSRFSPNHTFLTLAAQRLSHAVAADSHALDIWSFQSKVMSCRVPSFPRGFKIH